MNHEAQIADLLAVIQQLRAENGCPWDRAQTHESLIPFLEEESAEVIDAIHEKDPSHLKEELADLLLQILLHSEIAAERHEFNFLDVCQLLREKIIRRHPHVFAGKKYDSIAAQKADWQRIKQEERANRGLAPETSILAGIPHALPALNQAQILQAKAAKVGFDWDDINDVIAKVDEERNELQEAIAEGVKNDIKGELGDLFFSLVNLSRFLEIDPTDALNSTNQKFRRRFHYIEAHAGRKMVELSLEEMDHYWNLAKAVENAEKYLIEDDAEQDNAKQDAVEQNEVEQSSPKKSTATKSTLQQVRGEQDV